MKKVHLQQLLHDIIVVPATDDCIVQGLSLDSRTVKDGYLFFAFPGTQTDGRDYLEAAIQNGAIAVIAEADDSNTEVRYYEKNNKKTPIFSTRDVNSKLGMIAARFFGNPTDALTMVGVTGTSGKTSCSHFIAACLTMAGYPSGVIGTIGQGIYGHLQSSTHTTPNQIDLQHLFAEMVTAGVKYIAMEVSSHGLVQHRVNNIPFDVAIFTNLTREHLDYHGTMENYAAAKRLLFLQPRLRYAVINADDEFGRQLINEFHDQLTVYAYGIEEHPLPSNVQKIAAHHVKLDISGIAATIHSPWGEGVLHSRLLGRFNLSNLLAALTTLCILDLPLEAVIDYISRLHGVSGRMEMFGGGEQPLVIVDYSHKPDALLQALITLKEHVNGDIWCVFGCGGDRDQGKRPQMGAIAERHADHVVVTDDNPRNEDRKQIVSDILRGMKRPEGVVVEHDRARAIAHAINCAHAGDVVLVAGKGHENYQQVGAAKHPFNDAVTVQMILAGEQQ